MIHRFIRYEQKHVRNVTTSAKSSERVILELLEAGEQVIYRCQKSGNDLLPGLYKRSADRLLGPEEPEAAKQYPCRRCGVMNINRFKCTSCWDLVDVDTSETLGFFRRAI